MVIGTHCIGSCKSIHHAITAILGAKLTRLYEDQVRDLIYMIRLIIFDAYYILYDIFIFKSVFFLDNEEENDEYLNDQEPSVLKLDVMVRNTALQSKTDLYRDVHGFISKVLDVTDKDVESTNGSPLGVIMTSQHVGGMSLCKHSVNLYFIKFNSRDFYMMSNNLQFWVCRRDWLI